MIYEDAKNSTRWLVMAWARPKTVDEHGGWHSYTKITQFPYWAAYDIVAEQNLDANTLIMVHALPGTIESSINTTPLDVPGSHWYQLSKNDSSRIGVDLQEISEKTFIDTLQLLLIPKSETKTA